MKHTRRLVATILATIITATTCGTTAFAETPTPSSLTSLTDTIIDAESPVINPGAYTAFCEDEIRGISVLTDIIIFGRNNKGYSYNIKTQHGTIFTYVIEDNTLTIMSNNKSITGVFEVYDNDLGFINIIFDNAEYSMHPLSI